MQKLYKLFYYKLSIDKKKNYLKCDSYICFGNYLEEKGFLNVTYS